MSSQQLSKNLLHVLKNIAEPLDLFKITQGFPHLELWLGNSELTSTLVIRKMQLTFTNNGQNLSFVQKRYCVT